MGKRLLDLVMKEGELRTDAIPWAGGRRKDSPGEGARELERRLLVRGLEVHTETGAHAKGLETWERWAKRTALAGNKMTADEGRRQLEEVVAGLNDRFRANGRLPWQPRRARRAP